MSGLPTMDWLICLSNDNLLFEIVLMKVGKLNRCSRGISYDVVFFLIDYWCSLVFLGVF